jgi:alcohol dehydrogenase
MTPAVVKELQIIGSRCGTFREFREAIRILETEVIDVRVDKIYNVEDAAEAFETSLEPRIFKVAIKPT